MRALVDGHFDAVWRTLRRFGVPSAGVDDAAQRVFLIADRKLDEIIADGERAYLLGIAVRVASETRRSIRRLREDSAGARADAWIDPQPGPEELMDQKQARVALDRVLATLPFELRLVFVLFELEGMTLPEIAAAHEIPLGTATSRLRRARELFRAGCAVTLHPGDGASRSKPHE